MTDTDGKPKIHVFETLRYKPGSTDEAWRSDAISNAICFLYGQDDELRAMARKLAETEDSLMIAEEHISVLLTALDDEICQIRYNGNEPAARTLEDMAKARECFPQARKTLTLDELREFSDLVAAGENNEADI